MTPEGRAASGRRVAAILALVATTILASLPAAARSRRTAQLPIAGDYALPNPILTPGSVDPSVTLSDICNGTTKGRRRVSGETRAKVLADYNQPPVTTDDYELDHLVPLALGGDNSARNLWPQPAPDYRLKDELENAMQARACTAAATLQPAEAAEVLRQEQREIAEDWVAAARRYLGR